MEPEREIGKLLTERGLTLATAESCTGGLIAHRITNVPGSSGYFERGFIAYSNRSKTELLGVEASLLERCGAVSSEVAEAMAAGARNASGANLGLAVTGIAGPLSDESKKPVGLVHIAVCLKHGLSVCSEHNFVGERLEIKEQSADAALKHLVRTLIRFGN